MIKPNKPQGVVEKDGRVWIVMGDLGTVSEWVEITDTAPWDADE